MLTTRKRAYFAVVLFGAYIFLFYIFQNTMMPASDEEGAVHLHHHEAQALSPSPSPLEGKEVQLQPQSSSEPEDKPQCIPAAVNQNVDPNHTRAHLDFWHSLDNETVDAYREDWQNFIQNTVQEKIELQGRGVVLVAGNRDTFGRALTTVKMLRHYGCQLPVEVWHLHDEPPSNHTVKALNELNAVLHDLPEPYLPRPIQHRRDTEKQFQIKAAAIINSNFEELLYLDSDNIPVRDPSFLFETPAFVASGALFWPDFWKTHTENRIFEILDVPCNDEWEQESGQMVINKTRSWLPLQLAWYMQEHSDLYFQFLNGDKDTFKFAWKALGLPYHMTETFLGMGGIELDKFCGHTMLQYADDDDRPLFAHGNLMKIFDKNDFMEVRSNQEGLRERPWRLIKRYTHSKKETNLAPSFYVTPLGQPCMDFIWRVGQPDIVVEEFDNVLSGFQDAYFKNGGMGGEVH